MKKLMIVAMVAVAAAFGASAATQIIGETEWQYTVANGEATITRMINWGKRSSIDIPEQLGGCPVTKVSELEDFWHWDSLGRPSDMIIKQLSFPSTVNAIGEHLLNQSSGPKRIQFFVFAGKVPAFSRGNLYDALRPYEGNVIIYPREYASAWRSAIETANADGGNGYYTKYFEFGGFYAGRPKATVISSSIRENDPTIMDVVYKVTSTKPSVKVRVLAFEDGQRSLAKVVRPETFVDGTGVNVGDAVTANVEHQISWKVSSDWQTRLAKVKFEVLASEGELLPLETMTIPASDQYGKMKITWNAISESQVFDALLWLYADKDPGLTLANGQLRNGSTQLASGTGISAVNAMSYIYSKMGYSLLTGDLLTYANQETRLGLSPSGARQYGYKIAE